MNFYNKNLEENKGDEGRKKRWPFRKEFWENQNAS